MSLISQSNDLLKKSTNNVAITIENISQIDKVRKVISSPEIELIGIPQPSISELGYEGIYNLLMSSEKFNLALHGSIEEIMGQFHHFISKRIKTHPLLFDEQEKLEKKIESIIKTMHKIYPGKISFGFRNFFCYGDSILHVDNMPEGKPIRFLWAMNRPHGMRFTSFDNIDMPKYESFIQRELHLIRRMDSISYTSNKTIEEIWSHRKRQVELMKKGLHHYMFDVSKTYEVPTGWSSIHYVNTPIYRGTFHCNTFENINKPGLQLILTITKT